MIDPSQIDPTLPVIKALLVMDNEGRRIAVNYYTPQLSAVPDQAEFEKSVFAKTQRSSARGESDIVMLDDLSVVYRFVGDLAFYVAGSAEENEVLLSEVLDAYVSAVAELLRGSLDKKSALENLDLILLAADELIDGGLILETDGDAIFQRVSLHGSDESAAQAVEAAIANPGLQSLSHAFGSVREQIARNLLR